MVEERICICLIAIDSNWKELCDDKTALFHWLINALLLHPSSSIRSNIKEPLVVLNSAQLVETVTTRKPNAAYGCHLSLGSLIKDMHYGKCRIQCKTLEIFGQILNPWNANTIYCPQPDSQILKSNPTHILVQVPGSLLGSQHAKYSFNPWLISYLKCSRSTLLMNVWRRDITKGSRL